MASAKPNSKPNEDSEVRQAVLSVRREFTYLFWFSMVASLLSLASVLYMMEVYNHAVPTRNINSLVMLTILVLGAYAIAELMEWSRDALGERISRRLDAKLGDRVFTALFQAQLGGHRVGTQPLRDLNMLREFVNGPFVHALINLPLLPVFVGLIFWFHWILGVVVVFILLINLALAWAGRRASAEALIEANGRAMEAQQYADGTFRNAQVVEAMGMQMHIYRRWISKQLQFLRRQAEASDAAGGFMALSRLLQLILGSAMIGVGVGLQISGLLIDHGGKIIGANILVGKIAQPFTVMATNWRVAIEVREAWRRLERLLGEFPAAQPAMPLPAPRGQVQAEFLVAAPPGGGVPILRGVTFNLNPGDVLAVIGPSGAGKTTLARVLVGLWPSSSGKMRLDGADVYAWDKAELGPHIGYLPQEVELLDGTLGENIARFGVVDTQKVEAAARAVGLHEMALALPQGYDTQLGGDGARLSGGQRQRVALARALYGDPAFVVLDEPNSSLDEEGDAALTNAIVTMKARGTTFVINTHRTSIMGVTDKLLVLRDGQVQTFGTRDEVMNALRQASARAALPEAAGAAARPQAA